LGARTILRGGVNNATQDGILPHKYLRSVIVPVIIAAISGCSRHDYQSAWNSVHQQYDRGNTAQAIKLAEAEASRAAANRATPWDWQFRLLAAQLRLSAGNDPAKIPIIGESPPAGAVYDSVRARAKYVQARAVYARRDFAAAIPLFQDAEKMAAAVSDRDLLLDSQLMEGSCLSRTGNHSAAVTVLKRAAADAERTGDTSHQLGAMYNLGFDCLSQGRFDEALTYYETVVRETGPDTIMMHSAALNNAGICYSRLGEFDRAESAQRRAIDVQEKAGNVAPYLQATLAETGNTLILAGKPREAAQYLERAFWLAQQLKDPAPASMWAGNLAAAYIGLSDWNKAASFNDQAISLKQSVRGADTTPNTLNAALIAAGRGDRVLASRLFQTCLTAGSKTPAVLWEAHSGLGEFYSRSNPALAEQHFESALAIIEQTRSELLKPEWRISYLARLMNFYQVYVDALCRRGEWEKALEIADSSRARVLAERTTGAVSKRTPAAQLKAAAARSGQVVFYWLAPERSYAWVLSRGGIHGAELAPAASIKTQVKAYNATIDDTVVDPLAFEIPAASELSRLVVAPIARWLAPGVPIVVVPDGALNNINLETLPVYGERPHYWIEDVSIRVAPSISALASVEPNKGPAPPSLLLIGDPAPPDKSLPPLRSAALELKSVSSQFAGDSNSEYSGGRATPKAYLDSRPERFSVIHFTAHALANVDSPLDSAVVLSPSGSEYKLYARDILQHPIHAELVTISACRGAGARSYTGEGMVGFAWAFLRAGARNVIAGLWDVNDDSTARLMGSLYQELKSNPPAHALRQAQLSLVHAGPPWSRPYYWGPFQLYSVSP
jgi:CHAT domain-containing protein/tetratricopeptide (TPR) repeat protein